MAALDDILDGGTRGMKPKPVQVTSTVTGGGMQPAPKKATPQTVATVASREESKPGTDGQRTMEERQGMTGEKPRMSYVELYEAMNPQKPETAEERAKREKREKREAILAAVGDGISALSNLFFTTQYAPNAYDASRGMSAKARERWDKLRLEREANRRAYSDGYLRALAMDKADEREDRNWRHTLERERTADERYEIKAAQDKAMADLNEQLRRHQITAAEHKAEQERIAAQFAEETEKLKQENLRAGARQKDAAAGASKASASASYAKARHYNNGGGSGKVKHHFRGKEYLSDKDYTKDVTDAARAYNERHGKWVKNEDTGRSEWVYDEGFVPIEIERENPGKAAVARKPEEFAGEVERRLKEEESNQDKDDFSQYEVSDTDNFSQYEKK